jgi:hypothetical protein
LAEHVNETGCDDETPSIDDPRRGEVAHKSDAFNAPIPDGNVSGTPGGARPVDYVAPSNHDVEWRRGGSAHCRERD